jgi:long-chain acyl-CoA synthetase
MILSQLTSCQIYHILLCVFTVVTIYATLGDDAIAHGINETEVSIVITTHDLLPKFKNVLSKVPKITTLIYMEDQLTKTDTTGFKEGVAIISFSSVIKSGASTKLGESSSMNLLA